MVGAPVGVGPAGPFRLAALAAVLALAREGLGAFGPAGDGPHPGALPGRAALGGHLGDRLGADGGELFGAADAGEPLAVGAGPAGVVKAPVVPGAPQGRGVGAELPGGLLRAELDGEPVGLLGRRLVGEPAAGATDGVAAQRG